MSKPSFVRGAINGTPITGQPLWVHDDDYYCLYDYCLGAKNFVEIGSAFGYSSIVAAFAVTGEIHGIDAGWKQTWRNRYGRFEDVVQKNWENVGHDTSRLFLYRHSTPPLPPDFPKMTFDVGLVDGWHTPFDHIKSDFDLLADMCTQYVLIHDVNLDRSDTSPRQVFDWVAENNPEWEFETIRGAMGVLKRA